MKRGGFKRSGGGELRGRAGRSHPAQAMAEFRW